MSDAGDSRRSGKRRRLDSPGAVSADGFKSSVTLSGRTDDALLNDPSADEEEAAALRAVASDDADNSQHDALSSEGFALGSAGNGYAQLEHDPVTGSFAAKAARQDAYLDSDAYDPIAFGDFATYMRHKRQKLKVQENALLQEERLLREHERENQGNDAQQVKVEEETPQVFKGCCIYINGLTQPPYAELRRLIVLHGGDFMAYLDAKRPITHIVASSLTPKKRVEFKDYKVVNERWVLDSIKAGKRMDWRRYRVEAEANLQLEMYKEMKSQREQVAKSQQKQFTSKLRRVGEQAATQPEGAPSGTAANATPVTPEKSRALPPTALADKNNTSPWGKAAAQKKLFDVWQGEAPPSPLVEEEAVEDTKTNYTLGTDPASRAAAEHVERVPYASRPSNEHAARLLASPSWRERNTASSGDFLSGYFENSRLHYLSTWKMQMKGMVENALSEAGRELGSPALPPGVKRVIMHIDFDSFFVSVGLRDHPELVDKPVVVCHGQGRMQSADGGLASSAVQKTSTSEIASCNYVARSYGIRNGMSLGQARTKCASVQSIPYDFKAYNQISIEFYTILLANSDAIEAVSVDEALIDVSLLLQELRAGKVRPGCEGLAKYREYLDSQGDSWTEEKQLAEALRDEIRSKTRTEASIGIGSNVLLARLAMRKAKPGGSYHLLDSAVPAFLADLDIDDLHGLGWSARESCKKHFGCFAVADLLAKAKESDFKRVFGPEKGAQFWAKMHGRDRDKLEGASVRRSIGAAVNYAMRFKDRDEAETFVSNLAKEVAQRMEDAQLKGRKVLVTVMVRAQDAPVEAPKFLGHGVCDTFNKSEKLATATRDPAQIKRTAWSLIRSLQAPPQELRGIGISLQDLTSTAPGRDGPPAPKDGQSLLRFTTAKPKPVAPPPPQVAAPSRPAESKAVHFESPAAPAEEMHDLEELQAGPSRASRRVRSPSPEEDAPIVPARPVSPAPQQATQYVVPTQLDEAVLAEMPATMQAQLRAVADARASKPAAVPAPAPAAVPPAPVTLTASQIDHDTLNELPEDLRNEILRELGLPSRSSARLGPPEAKLPLRASTESPKKRVSTPTKPKQRLLISPPKGQPILDQMALRLMNPGAVKDAELQELEIDAEFYRALPADLQREMIRQQTAELAKARKAAPAPRAVPRAMRMTAAEKRAAEAARLRALDPESALTAVRRDAAAAGPALLGGTSTDEVRAAIARWFRARKGDGPRENDVARVLDFLAACVRPPQAAAQPDLAKAEALLRAWRALLADAWPDDAQELAAGSSQVAPPAEAQAQAPAEDPTPPAQQWWRAYLRCAGIINDMVAADFGAPLRL